MLPVQTVMIRYMVLVYRWGAGWLGAVGVWGSTVAGGCARRRAAATVPGAQGYAKAPPTKGRRGLSDYLQSRMAYSVIFLVCRIPRIWVK
mgnify:CR=1 FL=1